MPCMISGREIVLSGDVGDMSGWYLGEDGFSSSDVILALAQVGDANDVTIRLNSGGGIATEGSAIHSAIARHTGKVTMIVEGVAASAASVVAMAGDDVVMSLGAILMIHDPAGLTIGTAKDHQDQINSLNALGDAMASIYAAKSGQSAGACRADMAAETWMTAEQAVAKGYADRVEGAPANDDNPQPVEPAPFAYRAYRHAPEKIVALADARNWPRRLPHAAQETRTMPKPKAEQSVPAEPGATPAPVEPKPETVPEPVAEPKDDPVTDTKTEPTFSRADAAEIAEICANGGAPSMTAALIREGVTAAVARDRVNAAGQIRDVVALARKNAPHLAADLADKAIAAGKSVAAVKADLFDAMAAADAAAPVDAHHRAGAGGANRSAGNGDSTAKSKANMLKLVGASAKKEG